MGRRRMKRGFLLLTGVLGSALVLLLLILNGYALWQPGVVVSPVPYTLNSLPSDVPGTTLRIHNLVCYEGGYLEDGSDIYVSDVAAILLENTGTYGIRSARVILCWQGGAYVFDVEMLPPDTPVIVLEKDRQPYQQQAWTGCNGVQKTDEADWSVYPVQLAVQDQTKLQLKNQTDMPVTNLHIYYKNYLKDEQIFLGGTAYCYVVAEIPAGETVTVEPYRFVWGYSRIVQISCPARNDD